MSGSGYEQFFKAAKQAKGTHADGKKTNPSLSSVGSSPEQQIRDLFIAKRQKRRRMQKRKLRINWPGLGILSLLFVITGLGALYPEQALHYIDRIEVNIFAGADAAGTSEGENKGQAKGEAGAKAADGARGPDSVPSANTQQEVQQDMSYFANLSRRKDELDLRQKELNELEEELQKQRKEIEARIKHLEQVREQIASVLKDRVQIDQEKVDKLVEVYATMRPQQAAQVISTINEDLAIEILAKMKKKSAAAILNLLDPAKAQKLSEKFAGYIRK